MMGLASGGQRNRPCMRWKCAPVASDERCDFWRAQVVSIASDCGMMDWARTVIVGGIVTAALMKYRTKTATSWTEAIRRYGERRRRTSLARRIPDRAEDRRRSCFPIRARPVLPLGALSARPGLS